GFQTFGENNYGASNCLIEGNYVESFHDGVILSEAIPSSAGAQISDITIRNNVFNGGSVGGSWGVLIEGAEGIEVYHNVLVDLTSHGVGVRRGGSATVRNNVFYNVLADYWKEEDCDLVGGYNVLYPAGSQSHYDATDLRDVDPKFVDYANRDYRLSADSPAIDAGLDLGIPDDMDGNARPAGFGVDIGPYEYVPSTGQAPSLAIGAASQTETTGGPVEYVITYTNATDVSLSAGDITVNTTGSATGEVQVSGSGTSSRVATLSNISGNGTLSISLAAGTASNEHGSAPAAGPSATVDVDNDAPVITVLGDNPVTHAAGDAYVDAGATASDTRDGDLTSQIDVTNNVNEAVLGSYTVVYRVADELGNDSGDVVRTVNVIDTTPADTTPPVITVLGQNPVTLEVGTSYVDAGATATDDVDGDLTASIVVTNSVNSSALGTYTVLYEVSDASGNSASASRTVNVVDTTPPPAAGTYYVDGSHGSASDANPGSEAAPWLTIQHAAGIAQAGDTVVVKAGAYDERVTISLVSATAEEPLAFVAEPRRSVDMKGFVVDRSNFVRVEGFNISHNSSAAWAGGGIWVRGNGVEVVDCYFTQIPAAAVQFTWQEPWSQGCEIRDCYVYRCQFGFIVFGQDALVENNEVEELQDLGGGDVDYSRFFGDNITFRGNTFHGIKAEDIGSAHVDGFQTFGENNYGASNCLIEGNYVESFHDGVILSEAIPSSAGAQISDIT
ncbi:MAG: DUF5011 domain-containing protein, partial [bacterium]|nr:DUF5011 domain-containing protein [bacterium]